jgi:hypothetical protein
MYSSRTALEASSASLEWFAAADGFVVETLFSLIATPAGLW